MLSIDFNILNTNYENLLILSLYLEISYKTISAHNLACALSYLISNNYSKIQSPNNGLYLVNPMNKGDNVDSFFYNAYETF